MTSVVADLNGDGQPDRFVVFAHLSNGTPLSWWAEAILTRKVSPTPAYRLPPGDALGGTSTTFPRAIGAVDVNGDGRAEVFVFLTADLFHSGGQSINRIFGVRNNRVVPATSRGKPFVFRTDGISRFGDGARCQAAEGKPILDVSHVGQTTRAWLWSYQMYRWRGLRLVAVGRRSGRLPGGLPVYDPRVFHFYQLICGSLRLTMPPADSYPPVYAPGS